MRRNACGGKQAVRYLKCGLAPAQDVDKFEVDLFLFNKLIASLPRECGKVAHRTSIGRHNTQCFAALHAVECLFGAQDRQRASEPARIEFLVGFHRQSFGWRTAAEFSEPMTRLHRPGTRTGARCHACATNRPVHNQCQTANNANPAFQTNGIPPTQVTA